jgi:hypothetical protein
VHAHEARLRDYIDAYRGAIEGVRYRQLEALQPAPFASISHGGGGTAYVLWRLGDRRSARAWMKASLADRRRSALEWESERNKGLSFLHGRGGLQWLRLVMDKSYATASYARSARRVDAEEFIEGAAGYLTGIRLLRDPRLRDLGDELAKRLARRVRARKRWQPIDACGFAHHWPGILHALLAWGPAQTWLLDAMRGLLAEWSPDVARSSQLAASWCNGAAGTLLLWAKAYDVTADAGYLRAARLAAERATTASFIGSDLCCGIGGIAYALLELARVDREGNWRARAVELAAKAIEAPAMRWPNGLFRGHPGLVCLALDVLSEQPAGFPTIEA